MENRNKHRQAKASGLKMFSHSSRRGYLFMPCKTKLERESSPSGAVMIDIPSTGKGNRFFCLFCGAGFKPESVSR
jgi:hypothetical protein